MSELNYYLIGITFIIWFIQFHVWKYINRVKGRKSLEISKLQKLLSQLSSDMNNQILSIIFTNNIDIELIKKQTNTNCYILVKGSRMKDIYPKIEANIELHSTQYNYDIREDFTIKTSDLIFIEYLVSQIISLYSINGKIKYEFLKRSILLYNNYNEIV